MTGENVSMLVFIRSKVDLKQIFDTDDYTSDTESILRTSMYSSDGSEIYGNSEFHLRQ
jgi:hypothetical protein